MTTPGNMVSCSLGAEFALVKENILIQEEKITQLYVIQSKHDPLLWFGMLFVDSGIYIGAVIRFNMVIPISYPNSSCPKIFFDPIPYHPLIDPDTGQLDTKNAFHDWNSTTHKLHQLLTFVKRVIYHVELYTNQILNLFKQAGFGLEISDPTIPKVEPPNASALESISDLFVERNDINRSQFQENIDNSDEIVKSQDNLSYSSIPEELKDKFINFSHTVQFLKLYLHNREEFKKLTDTFMRKCSYQIYDKPNIPHGEDENALVFTEWDPYLHETTRQSILAGRFAPTLLFASYHKETDRVSFVPGIDTSESK